MTFSALRSLAIAASLALPAAAAQAAVVFCPGTAATTDREFSLDTTPNATCIASGNGNINGNPAQDPFLLANPSWLFLDKSDTAGGLLDGAITSITGGGTGSGTITLQSNVWSLYGTLAIALKSGQGQLNPDWVVFQLNSASGTGPWNWTISEQGLSHANLYGKDPRQQVPEPATLALLGLALVGAAAARRRR